MCVCAPIFFFRCRHCRGAPARATGAGGRQSRCRRGAAAPGGRESAAQAAADAATHRERALAYAQAHLAAVEIITKEAEAAAKAAGEPPPIPPEELDKARLAEATAAAAAF